MHDFSSVAEDDDQNEKSDEDDDEANAFGAHAMSEVGQAQDDEDLYAFPSEWQAEEDEDMQVDASAGVPSVDVPDDQFEALNARELTRINLHSMPSLDEARLPAATKQKHKGARDPARPSSGSQTPRPATQTS